MKKIITTLAIVLSFGTGAIANAATVPYAGQSAGYTVSDVELKVESDVAWVMQANGINHTEALARIRHALDSQKGRVVSTVEVPKDYTPTYNPTYNAIQQGGYGFYAGVNKTDGRHVFTTEQRAQMLEGIYRYCRPGLSYVFEGITSACK